MATFETLDKYKLHLRSANTEKLILTEARNAVTIAKYKYLCILHEQKQAALSAIGETQQARYHKNQLQYSRSELQRWEERQNAVQYELLKRLQKITAESETNSQNLEK